MGVGKVFSRSEKALCAILVRAPSVARFFVERIC